jgi:hypothetical protein
MFQCALEGNTVGPGREARAVRAPRSLNALGSRASRFIGVVLPLLDLSKMKRAPKLASLHCAGDAMI